MVKFPKQHCQWNIYNLDLKYHYNYIAPVGHTPPRVSGDRLQEVNTELQTTATLLCQGQGFPKPSFRYIV